MLGAKVKCKADPCDPFCESYREDGKEHFDSGSCGVDLCGSWTEVRCLDCGWYNTECRCGCCNGYSKITNKQWDAIYKRKKK